LAFLRDSDDVRHSPALAIIDALAVEADVVVHDPFVKNSYKAPLTRSLDEAIAGSDCAVIVTDHSCYKELDLVRARELMRTPSFVDGRNVLDSEACAVAGLAYWGLGKGRRTGARSPAAPGPHRS
jgi:UDP-N-acetyl-D-mannosaminuronate dehydrogenase